MLGKPVRWGGVMVLMLLGASARADDADALLRRDDEIAELKRQVGVLVEEVSSLRNEMAVPEERPLESAYGLGPAASKVYGVAQGLSVGGYAEAVYTKDVATDGDGSDESDFVRMVLYAGYKFTDKLLFNTELEFEHANVDEGGDVSVEFATLDYLYRDELNFRGGLLLVPMGFLNEMHEPPFYYGNMRPTPEQVIIPTTWRENGVGVFGSLGEHVDYRAYVVNGFDASGFTSAGLRGGRQKGSRAKSEDFAFVARLDTRPLPGLTLGASLYHGDSGQDTRNTTTMLKLPSTLTRIYEGHLDYGCGPLRTRGLLTYATLSDAADLSTALGLASNRPVGEEMLGGYLETALELMGWIDPDSERSLAPFFRFEYVDTQHEVPSGYTRDRGQPRRIYVPGLQFKPIPNVVLKLDYRNIDNWSGSAGDEINLGFGVVF